MLDHYKDLYHSFRWHVPRDFNLAQACCLKWARTPGFDRRSALMWRTSEGDIASVSFGELARDTSQLAHGLARLGVIKGERVLIIMDSPAHSLCAYFACWAMGAVAVALTPSDNSDLLLAQVKQSRGQVALIDQASAERALPALGRCSRIKHIVGVDVYDGRVMSWRGLTARQPDTFETVNLLPCDPALLVWPEFTSPDLPDQSALLLAHQGLIGQLPGFVCLTNWFPQNAQKLLCTFPVSSEIGLMSAILPTLYFGHTVMLETDLTDLTRLPANVTHIVTSQGDLIGCLKSHARSDSKLLGLKGLTGLTGLTVLGSSLSAFWREQVQEIFSVKPNLGFFISGCGLILGQSQTKWSNATLNSMRVFPGHRVNLTPLPAIGDGRTTHQQLEIQRCDIIGQTDPSQFIQLWPLKDSLQVDATLNDSWRVSVVACEQGQNELEVFGDFSNFVAIGSNKIRLTELEQSLAANDQIDSVQVLLSPAQRAHATRIELWVIYHPCRDVPSTTAPWRAELHRQTLESLQQAFDSSTTNISIRVGLIHPHARTTLPKRYANKRLKWATRQEQSGIDFL
jgi:acetyl-CoA synthetase